MGYLLYSSIARREECAAAAAGLDGLLPLLRGMPAGTAAPGDAAGSLVPEQRVMLAGKRDRTSSSRFSAGCVASGGGSHASAGRPD